MGGYNTIIYISKLEVIQMSNNWWMVKEIYTHSEAFYTETKGGVALINAKSLSESQTFHCKWRKLLQYVYFI